MKLSSQNISNFSIQMSPDNSVCINCLQTHAFHLSMDEVITIQRVLKHKGVTCTPEDVSTTRSKSNNTVSCGGWD